MDTSIVRIRSLLGGHYRGGRYIDVTPQDIEARTLSRKELAALQGDPGLSVEIIKNGDNTETISPAE